MGAKYATALDAFAAARRHRSGRCRRRREGSGSGPDGSDRQAGRPPPRRRQRPPDRRAGRGDPAHLDHGHRPGGGVCRAGGRDRHRHPRNRAAARARDAGPRRGRRADDRCGHAGRQFSPDAVAGRHRTGRLARGDVRVARADVGDDAPQRRSRQQRRLPHARRRRARAPGARDVGPDGELDGRHRGIQPRGRPHHQNRRRDRVSDQHPRAQRRRRSGARGRSRNGLCRGRRRSRGPWPSERPARRAIPPG